MSPEEHLQQDWQLFQRLEAGSTECLWRTWETPRPAVVVGRSASIAEHVILDACQADGVPVLRRFTGGGTVVLGPGCLNYAIALPLVSCPELDNVARSFALILGRISAALGVQGLRLAGTTDLALGGRKVSGNAQRRGRRALVQHGTLLYDFDARLAARYLREPPRQPAYRTHRNHEAFLGNLPLPRRALETRLGELQADLASGSGLLAREYGPPDLQL